MEVESELGSKILIVSDSDTQIGRQLGLGFGLSSTDRSISRRHLSLRLIKDPIDGYRVGFEVIGKNPIWVCSGNGGDGRMYKKFEKGELRVGDKLSLSLKKPFFSVLKRREGEREGDEERKRVLGAVERREKRTLERRREREEKAKEEAFECEDDEGIGSVDVSQIDPVKEFGFLVKSHEFDQYSKNKIPGIKNWNWFLKEIRDVTDDDDETIDEPSSSEGKKGRGIHKKKHGGDDDEEWAGDDGEENVVVVKGGTAKRPKYSTRSKDSKRSRIDASGARDPSPRKDAKVHEVEVEDEDEEEEDETLGGFIVDEEEVEEEEAKDEESEEEFYDEEEDEEELE